MEDAKNLISETEPDSELSQGEARLTDFCESGLSLNANTCTEAVDLFKKTKHLISTTLSTIGNGETEEAERYWFAFVLYSIKRLKIVGADSQESGKDVINLSQILKTAKLNIVDFFKELPQFVVKAGPILSSQYGADWEKRLEAKELQANFVHLSLLSKYYKRAFEEFFLKSDANVDEKLAVSGLSKSVSDYYRFGWLLFLSLRVHAFSRFKDLVTCTNGLVAILAILILHVPARLRNFIINESPKFVKKGDKGVDLLASLCRKYETSEDELKKTMENTNNIIVDILKKDPRPAPECNSLNLENINTEDLIYFEDLMEGTSLSSSLNILEKDYADATHNKVELDERVFINDEDGLLGSGTLSGGAINIKSKVDLISSPTKTITSPLSPFRSPSISRPAATPVTTAMTTAKWLRTIISPLSPKPSQELELFLSSCDRNLTNDVTRRANIILEAIFPTIVVGEQCVSGSLMDSIWAEQRKLESLKLYYRVLQSMCIAESQVLQSSNLTSLLTNERFHRCMLACSAELVLATHKTVTMLFPAVLERTGISSFDLSKVIESFVRHEESLPRELRRHLNSLEERLLESLVWEKGSSMYNSLTVARPALSSEIIRLGLSAEPMPSLDSIAMHMNIPFGSPSLIRNQTSAVLSGLNGDMRSPKRLCTENRSALVERNSFKSPVKDRLLAFNNLKLKQLRPALQCSFASPTRPVPGVGEETCAEAAINIFFCKIMKLAAVRINGMVERLQVSQLIRESVYSLYQKILSQKTALFFSRHIDQIILCCFYGVAKISQLSLTFREIIFNYRKQPQCKPQVFRSVYVDWSSERRPGKTGQEHVDIITFYNEVFVPAVKPLLVELAPNAAAQRSIRDSETNGKTEGQCPASPKVSTFPSLPDMSPKKVSAVHNVYVSPLRSSKMDVLVSNGSKSYYACVGESTHAYQSPSKDLTAINTRLNGSASNRKVRGTLNFDEVDAGLVSDSVVANSFYIQNGSCALSSDAPVKSEQPDS